MDIADINMDELFLAIKNLKRHKAPGPDNIRIEFFKERQGPRLQIMLELINKWWDREPIPTELTQAQVILLRKKGDTIQLSDL